MYTPQHFLIALLMIITSTICWGSWANTFKWVKNYRFEFFYWDYAIGIFVISVVLAFTMGSTHAGASSFLANVHSADYMAIGAAIAGGVVFNLANLLLMAGVEMVGLAVSFPVSIGLALVVGVVLSYALQPRGNPILLAIGVALAIVAVILDGKAYGALRKTGEKVSRKGLWICAVSGVLMGLWAPFVTRALTEPRPLGPYSATVFLTLGALLSCFVFNTYLMKKPITGEPVSGGGFFRAAPGAHWLGLVGGFIWGIGTVFNLVAANLTGVAISYAIGQASPMVAALWGIFAWREFRGAGPRPRTYLTLMFVFYVVAIVIVAGANRTA